MRSLLITLYPLVVLLGYIILPVDQVPIKRIGRFKNVVVFKGNDPFPKSKGSTVRQFGTLSVKLI